MAVGMYGWRTYGSLAASHLVGLAFLSTAKCAFCLQPGLDSVRGLCAGLVFHLLLDRQPGGVGPRPQGVNPGAYVRSYLSVCAFVALLAGVATLQSTCCCEACPVVLLVCDCVLGGACWPSVPKGLAVLVV